MSEKNLPLTKSDSKLTDRLTGTRLAGDKFGPDVNIAGGTGPLAGVDWNYLDVQQTSATVETYLFYDNSVDLTLLKTLVITYTSSTKKDIDDVEWT